MVDDPSLFPLQPEEPIILAVVMIMSVYKPYREEVPEART